MLPEMTEQIQAAAEEIEQMMLAMHKDDKGVHVNTVLSTMAAVTAEAILRASTNEAQLYGERGAVFSLGAEEILFRAKTGNVMNYIMFTAKEVGLAEMAVPNIEDLLRIVAANIGKNEIPVLTIPKEHRPHFWAMGGATHARPKLLEIYAKHKLRPIEAALATTLLLCRFLHSTNAVLAPDIAFRLVLETLAGAVRLHPISREDLDQMAAKQVTL